MTTPAPGAGAPAASPLEDVPALEGVVATVLRVGVLVSCAVIAAGTVLTLVTRTTRDAARRALPGLRRGVLHPAASHFPHTLSGVAHGVAHGDGPSLAVLGVLLLIATPVLRVGVTVVGYVLGRDRPFMVITAVVLAILVASFALA